MIKEHRPHPYERTDLIDNVIRTEFVDLDTIEVVRHVCTMFSTGSSILFLEFLFGLEHFCIVGNRDYQKCVFPTHAYSYSLYEVTKIFH